MAAAMTALRRMTGLVAQPDLRPGPLPATTPARRESKSKTAETRALMQLGGRAGRVREKRKTVRSALAFTESEDGWLRVAGTRAARRRRRARTKFDPFPA